MKKNTVELIITAILIIVLLLAVGHMLTARKKFIARKQSMKATPGIATGSLLPAVTGRTTFGDFEEYAQKLTWGRDPFRYGASHTGTTSLDLTLHGIVWDTQNPKAMINDFIVGIGERFDKYTVIDIQPDSVLINDGTKDTLLRL